MRRQGYLNVTLAPQNTVKFDEALASASSLCCLVDKLFNQNRVDQNVADSTKILFVLMHGQSNIVRGFSVNRQMLDDNLQEKSHFSVFDV